MLIKKQQWETLAGALAANARPEAQDPVPQDAYQPSPVSVAMNAPAVPSGPHYTPDAVERGELPDRRGAAQQLAAQQQAILEQALAEAATIREQAHEQAYQEGFAKGVVDGEAQGLAQTLQQVDDLRAQFAQVLVSRADVLASVVSDIAPLAIEIAERLMKTEISADEGLVMVLVEDALQKLGRDTRHVAIKVNPDEMASVKKGIKALNLPQLKAEIMVIPDGQVEPGGCIIETNSGLIDATLHTRLTMLRAVFGVTEGEAEAG